jgi:putative intracellular protease/amidase
MSLVARALNVAIPIALAAGALACASTPPPRAATSTDAKHYVCTACGSACDLALYDHPGVCPQCGMPLVEKGLPAAQQHKGKAVAILLFDNVEIIDFTGPWEVFGAAGFDVYTVAATTKPVTTAMGMTVVPRYAFANAPQPAVLIVPGGGVGAAQHDDATLRWVADTSGHTEQTLSVCNGAFILASAGLLDGLSATTTYHLLAQLHAKFPKVTVVSDRRYVDNGAIVTAAGLSSGIDGALHVVDKMLGRGAAQKAALGIEYDWHPDGSYVRARLADRVIPDVDLDALGGHWAIERTEGTTDRWDVAVRGMSLKSAAEVLDAFDRSLVAKGHWQRVSSNASSRAWRFEDEEGKPWMGSLAVEPLTASEHEYTVKLGVSRAQ